jgi:hypothetical protein
MSSQLMHIKSCNMVEEKFTIFRNDVWLASCMHAIGTHRVRSGCGSLANSGAALRQSADRRTDARGEVCPP